MNDVTPLRELPVGTVVRYFQNTHETTIVDPSTPMGYVIDSGLIKVRSHSDDRLRTSGGEYRIARDRGTFNKLGMGNQHGDGWIVSLPVVETTREDHSELVLPDGPREWDS